MYIRTKDGRIIDTTKIVTGSKFMDFATNDESFRVIFKTDPLVKADTIEELCDEFVMTHYFKETNYTKCEVLKEDKDLMIEAVRLKKQHNEDEDLKNEFNIYGCIWTTEGLKYVAKMNDKGELELI